MKKKIIKYLTIAYINLFIIMKGALAQPTMENQNKNNAETAKDKVLHTMCYSHLDTEWRWDYKVTIRDYILNTMKDNFKLFEKYPNYIFNFSGANRYKMMKEYYPKDYELVKKYIAEGRWFPCGSSIEENDALVPSPESIIRQILYGNNYFKKEFGKESLEFMLPDCFGFSAALPSILAHCGLKGFSTQKLTWGSAMGVPFNIGLWEGPDGESVIAAFNPGDYVTNVKEDLGKCQKWIDRIESQGKLTGLFKDYMYVGTGDWGGAPTDESIKWIEESIKSDGPLKVIFAPADKLFKEITPAEKSKLPKYKGELLLTNHSAGSITSAAYMKRWNRKNELLAYSAEASSVFGSWLGGIKYPQEKINEAWRLVMGAQFHDILPGTSIPKAYEYAWNDEALALNQFGNVLADASGSIARAMDTRAKGIPLMVFNPLSFARVDVVKATVNFPEKAPNYVKVINPENTEVPSQVLSIEGNKVSILFLASVPSVGYSVYDVIPSDVPCEIETGLKVTNASLENSAFVVKINANGDVSGIYDKKNSREVLSAPARLAFLTEIPSQWPAWNMDWNDRKNPPSGYVDGPATIKITEPGPVRITLEVTRESKNSKFIQYISLSAAKERIEFDNKIDWFSKKVSLKQTFPLTVSNPQASYNTGLGVINRGNNDSIKFEVPSQQWFDLSDEMGDYGVSILEDSKYGSDKPSDNELRLTLLYTPGARSDYKDQATQDFGKHEILYAIYPHKNGWREANTDSEAAGLNQPLIPFQTVQHDGKLGKTISCLKISNNNVILSALKKAENSDDIIFRVRETKGKPADGVEITFPTAILTAKEVNGQEQDLSDANIKDGKLVFDIGSFHPKTFAVKIVSPDAKLNLPLSEPLLLTLDIKAISSDENKSDADFDGKGNSYPAELVPQEIISEGIKFRIGDKTGTALKCEGQTIKIPSGNFNRLYILAASIEDDTKAKFTVDNKEEEFSIGKWSGYIGSFDNRTWDGYTDETKPDYQWSNIEFTGLIPGYIKTDNVALFTTHSHLKNDENNLYNYAYIYKYCIDIKSGSKEIVLPKNDKVRIFAITAAFNENDNTRPSVELYDKFDRKTEDYRKYQVCIRPKIIAETFIIDQADPLEVKIETAEKGGEIRYTLDNTAPNENSTLYTKPLKVTESITLKAAAFLKGKNPSKIIEAGFYKAYQIKDIKYITACSPKYTGMGERTLIDSIRASVAYNDKSWLGYEGDDPEVILDLGSERPLHRIILGCLNNHGSWIFLPKGIDIFVSNNNIDFTPAGSIIYDAEKGDESLFVKDFLIPVQNISARYIKVKIKSLSKCPSWHPGAGGKCWVFVDEIIAD